MEKIIAAGLITLICLSLIIPKKPWVTPSESGPQPVSPTYENLVR